MQQSGSKLLKLGKKTSLRDELKDDDRGRLVELFKDELPENAGQVYLFTVKAGMCRGDHYHKHKDEWFIVLKGRCTLTLEKDGEKEYVELNNTDLPKAFVPAGVKHTFTVAAMPERMEQAGFMSPDCLLIAYISEKYNPDDEDTYRE